MKFSVSLCHLSVQISFIIQRSGIRKVIAFFFLFSRLMQTLKNALISSAGKLILPCLLTAGECQIKVRMVKFSFKYYSIDCNSIDYNISNSSTSTKGKYQLGHLVHSCDGLKLMPIVHTIFC